MDELDFEAFVSARSLALTRFAYLLTGDRAEAEDVVQEALVKAYRNWSRVVRADHPEAYVRRIVVTTHLNERRRLRWRRERVVGAGPVEAVEVATGRAWDDPGVAVTESDALHAALRLLAPRQRAVLVMRHYLAMDDAAIAAELGCTEVTVRATVSKAKGRLRELLAPSGDQSMIRGKA